MTDFPPEAPPPSTPDEAAAKPVPTLQEQSDQIAALMLASARRLATDPEHLARIKKLLF